MAMSRILSQSLPRPFLGHPKALFSANRHRSSKAHRAHLVEIDAEQPDSPEVTAEVIALGIRKLEDAIHSIIVRRTAPDWLPFLPGYSYWVPPRLSPSTSFNADQPAAPDSPEAAAEVIAFGIRKLEDAMHSIIERRAAPDWLPFLPGYSYFNAHQPAGSMIEVIGKLASSEMVRNRISAVDLLSEDEQKAFSSNKGWPSSAFYLEETSPVHRIPVVKLETKIQDKDEQVNSRSESEDED